MKKLILVIAFVATGVFGFASVQAANSVKTKAVVEISNNDDGFVVVELKDLNEKVQAAITSLSETFDINVIKYNAEQKVTMVELTSKEDQTAKTVYFNDEGAEINWEAPVDETGKEE